MSGMVDGEVVDPQRALREADRHKDEFLATLGHELRTPLGCIRAALAGLELDSSDPIRVDRTRVLITRQVDHLLGLVDDLLDLARIRHGKLRLRLDDFDLHDAVAAALDATRPALRDAGHRLDVSTPGATLRVEADRTRVTQVMANLLANAIRYTPPGGRIALSVDREPGGAWDVVAIRVRDTGQGIPAELLSRVFDLFAQAERPAVAGAGLGIGLALVRRIVELHGGTIEIDSEVGRGTEVTVRLPVLVPAEAVAALAPATRHRVLIIDDSHDVTEALADVVGGLGHEAARAHDGATALSIAAEWHPDTIFCDLALPDMTGFEVVRTLRRCPRLGLARIFALSGRNGSEDIAQARAAGFDEHITKPPTLATFRRLLGDLRGR